MFRFTIRDVLWLTVVAALGVGWAIDHFQFSSEDRSFMRQVKEQKKKLDWQSSPPMSN